MPVEKSFRRLRRIGLDETGVRLRQVETKHMQLHAHAADDADAFAEIDLRVARRMGERDEDLARSGAGDPHVILHHRVAAGIAMLDPQPFENPLRRMPLLGRRRLVGLQDRVDDRNQRSELRLFRRLGPHIARWRGISAHLGDRIPAQSKDPRRLAPALPFDKDKPSNRCVSLHRKHPRPPLRIKVRKGSAQKWPGFTPPRRPHNAAAPWPTIAPPRTLSKKGLRDGLNDDSDLLNEGKMILLMMGRSNREQANFFLEFRSMNMIPKGHLLRRINVGLALQKWRAIPYER